MTKRITIFEAGPYAVDVGDLRNREVFASIWEDDPENVPSAEKLDGFYLGNPAGPPTIFLLWSEDDKRYVGILFASPRVFCSGTIELNGAVFADLFVEKKHRTLGPSCLLLRHARNYLLDRVDFVYGFMNPMATLVGKRIGLTFRDPAISLGFPLDVRHHVQKRMRGTLGSIAGQLLALFYSAIIFTASRITGLWFEEEKAELKNLTIDVRALSACRKGEVFGMRSGTFLQWRLKNYPVTRISHHAIRDRQGRIVGFLAYSVREAGRVSIEDLIATSSLTLIALLTSFLNTVKHSGNVSLQVNLPSESRETVLLRRLGFRKNGELTLFLDWSENNAPVFAQKPVYLSPVDNDV